MEGLTAFIDFKPTLFVIEFGNYLGHVLGDLTYTGHFLVEVLVPLLRENIQPETLTRISLIMDHLAQYPDQVKYHMMMLQ
jgi:hypothetical protein